MQLECWNTKHLDWPIYGTHQDKLRFLLSIALLAPSVHNSQPWQYQLANGHLDVLADIGRRLPIVDPDHRELLISCGCAIAYLDIAARRFSHRLQISYYPNASIPNLLARIHILAGEPASKTEIRQFNAIWHRHTNRNPFQPESVPIKTLKNLQCLDSDSRTALEVITSGYRCSAISNLVARGNQLQANNKRFRRELAEWVRPNQTDSQDGIPGYALGTHDLSTNLGSFFIKTFNWGNRQSATDRFLIRHSAALLVLSSQTDSPLDRIKTGESLARLLLTITTHDLQASFLNQPIELPELRIRLKKLLKLSNSPQIIIRIGYASPTQPTPRRSLNDVLTTDSVEYI